MTEAKKREHLRTIGVEVHPKTDWPWPHVAYGGQREIQIPTDMPLHTTQAYVDLAHVARIRQAIETGKYIAPVEVVRVGDRFWIVDGHHTLVAYRLLSRAAPGVRYTSGPEGPLQPPQLTRKSHDFVGSRRFGGLSAVRGVAGNLAAFVRGRRA